MEFSVARHQQAASFLHAARSRRQSAGRAASGICKLSGNHGSQPNHAASWPGSRQQQVCRNAAPTNPSLPSRCPTTQIASLAIVVNQLKSIYDTFFLSECERCRGTGIVTCPHVSTMGRQGGRGAGEAEQGARQGAGQSREQGKAGCRAGLPKSTIHLHTQYTPPPHHPCPPPPSLELAPPTCRPTCCPSRCPAAGCSAMVPSCCAGGQPSCARATMVWWTTPAISTPASTVARSPRWGVAGLKRRRGLEWTPRWGGHAAVLGEGPTALHNLSARKA